jgi:hypothetical protein
MPVSRRIALVFCSALLAVLLACSISLAAPITVKLRVEGSAKTLFEGNIATEAETFETPSSGGPHPCNYSENGASEGFANGGNASGTPTTALRDAAHAAGLAFDAEWFGSGAGKTGNPGDFFVSTVSTDVNETKSPFASWGYAVNDTTAPVGGCQIALAPGNEVLWAYNYFNLPHLLSLSGAATAASGTPVTLHVSDAQTGAPLSGASIGELNAGVTTILPGNPTTDTGGNVSVTLSHTGAVTLKATRAESVRSNGLVVCVHNGNDGSCGTTLATGPSSTLAPPTIQPSVVSGGDLAKIAGVMNGHVYRRRSAPRLLGGTVEVRPGGTLRQVRISLERRYRGRCFEFSGSRERFVRVRRCGARFFSVGGAESFSYLLPAPLPPGRYVFEMQAVESTGQITKLVNGVSRVLFRVR